MGGAGATNGLVFDRPLGIVMDGEDTVSPEPTADATHKGGSETVAPAYQYTAYTGNNLYWTTVARVLDSGHSEPSSYDPVREQAPGPDDRGIRPESVFAKGTRLTDTSGDADVTGGDADVTAGGAVSDGAGEEVVFTPYPNILTLAVAAGVLSADTSNVYVGPKDNAYAVSWSSIAGGAGVIGGAAVVLCGGELVAVPVLGGAGVAAGM